MRTFCSTLLVVALLAAGVPSASAQEDQAAPAASMMPAALAVATGALALLQPGGIAGTLAALDVSLPDSLTEVVDEAGSAFSETRGGAIACPVPNRTEVVDSFGEWRGSHRHAGVDIRAPHGAPVHAVLGGTITAAAHDGAYGLSVSLEDARGDSWLFAHLSAVSVRAGDTVVAGARIGAVGCTGRCSGPHLHLERRTPDDRVRDTYAELLRSCGRSGI